MANVQYNIVWLSSVVNGSGTVALYTSDGDIVSNGESLKLFGDVCGVTIGGGTFVKPNFAYFGQFRQFCCEFTRFLSYFYRAK